MSEIPAPSPAEISTDSASEAPVAETPQAFAPPEGKPIVRSYLNAEGVPLGTTAGLLTEIDNKVANHDFKNWRRLVASTKDAIIHEGKASGLSSKEIKAQIAAFSEKATMLKNGGSEVSETDTPDVIDQAVVAASDVINDQEQTVAEDDAIADQVSEIAEESSADSLDNGEVTEPQEPDEVQETDSPDGEETSEAEAEQQKLVSAFENPTNLLEALQDPEFPQDVKVEVMRLVSAFRDLEGEQKLQRVWTDEVAPHIERMANGGIDSIRHTISNITDSLEQKSRAANQLANAIYDRYPAENIAMFARSAGFGELTDEMLAGARYRRPIINILDEMRRSANSAISGSEGVDRLRHALKASEDAPITPEELEEIYARHGSELQQGLTDSARSLATDYEARTGNQDSVWRRRSEAIENVALSINRFRSSDVANEGVMPLENRIIELVGEIQYRARSGADNYVAEMSTEVSRMIMSLASEVQDSGSASRYVQEAIYELNRIR